MHKHTRTTRARCLVVATLLGLVLGQGACGSAMADCADFRTGLDSALRAQDPERLLAVLQQARRQGSCPDNWLRAYERKASQLVSVAAGGLIGRGQLAPARLLLSRAPASVWQLHATRGDLAAKDGDWKEAAAQYGLAYDLASDPRAVTNPDSPAMHRVQERLFRYTAEALAQVGSLKNVISRSGDGSGILSSRGFKPEYLPLPIRFDFDRATLTPGGKDSVERLALYVRQENPGQLEVIGHTDPLGGRDYNLRLSQRRAETVREHLLRVLARLNGGSAEPVLPRVISRGEGESCAPVISDPGRYTQQEIHQLYRRVELKLGSRQSSGDFRRCAD